jgi:hypothetical protein
MAGGYCRVPYPEDMEPPRGKDLRGTSRAGKTFRQTTGFCETAEDITARTRRLVFRDTHSVAEAALLEIMRNTTSTSGSPGQKNPRHLEFTHTYCYPTTFPVLPQPTLHCEGERGETHFFF